MKKFAKPIIFVFFFLICYLLIISVLKKVDPQPDWAKLDIPRVVIPGKDLVFTIHYNNIQNPLQLFTALSYRNQDDIYCGQKHYTDSIPIVYGEGKFQQSLSFNPPDSVHKVMIRLSLHALSEKEGISIYQCKRIGKPFNSEWIFISKDGSYPQEIDLSLTDILEKGYIEGYWKDKRGDPTIIGWFITLLYLLVSVISFYFLRRIRAINPDIDYKWFWLNVGILIFLLGINKQLDIQMLFADFARLYAKVSGMFENRKPFQQKIISLLATIGISFFTFMIYKLWNAPKRMWMALVGFCILFSFPLIRLVSLHSIEALLYSSILTVKVVDVLELIGIAIIFTTTFLNYSAVKNNLAYKPGYEKYR